MPFSFSFGVLFLYWSDNSPLLYIYNYIIDTHILSPLSILSSSPLSFLFQFRYLSLYVCYIYIIV